MNDIYVVYNDDLLIDKIDLYIDEKKYTLTNAGGTAGDYTIKTQYKYEMDDPDNPPYFKHWDHLELFSKDLQQVPKLYICNSITRDNAFCASFTYCTLTLMETKPKVKILLSNQHILDEMEYEGNKALHVVFDYPIAMWCNKGVENYKLKTTVAFGESRSSKYSFYTAILKGKNCNTPGNTTGYTWMNSIISHNSSDCIENHMYKVDVVNRTIGECQKVKKI